MALGIIAPEVINHPIKEKIRHGKKHAETDAYSLEDLLMTLEFEDPMIMPLSRLGDLVNGTHHYGPTSHLRGYLVGILDCRLMMSAVM